MDKGQNNKQKGQMVAYVGEMHNDDLFPPPFSTFLF